jgi:hypothetical protein
MLREHLSSQEQRLLSQYVDELFELEMRSLPRPAPGERHCEIEGTPYHFDIWVMTRVAEFIVSVNSVEIARLFHRPIIELGPAGRYWVEDFLQTWVSVGLEMTADPSTFVNIWEDIVHYAMSLPAWQPDEDGYWAPAERLAVDLVGLHEMAASVLGQAKYQTVVEAMAPVFEEWASCWLKHASAAAWFAHFLTTESGRVLLSLGIKQLAGAVGQFRDRDWEHHDLGALLSEALAAGWKYLPNDIEAQSDLRKAFLGILTHLCARQIPEALHLRNKVSEVFTPS